MNRDKLIIVDMLDGFTKIGPLHDSAILKIVKPILELAKDKDVIFVNDAHDLDCVEFKSFPIHCLKGSDEAEVIDELKHLVKENVYYKNSTNAFFTLQQANQLDPTVNYTICGCCTDICVLHLALTLKTYFNEVNQDVAVRVYQSAVSTFDSPFHQASQYSEAALLLLKVAGVEVIE